MLYTHTHTQINTFLHQCIYTWACKLTHKRRKGSEGAVLHSLHVASIESCRWTPECDPVPWSLRYTAHPAGHSRKITCMLSQAKQQVHLTTGSKYKLAVKLSGVKMKTTSETKIKKGLSHKTPPEREGEVGCGNEWEATCVCVCVCACEGLWLCFTNLKFGL